jgi:hypothetical protein
MEFDFQPDNLELQNRCQLWNVNDPLTNSLKGLNLLGLRASRLLDRRTRDLFKQVQENPDMEKLYSFFRTGMSINAKIWKDIIPTQGKVWVENGQLQHGVARFDGSALDGQAVRVMDIHNHPDDTPPSLSFTDDAFFLKDLDMLVQVVTSSKGTLIMAKTNRFNSSNIDEGEMWSQYLSIQDQYPGDSSTRDKEFNIWLAKKYHLKLYWVKRNSRLLRHFH